MAPFDQTAQPSSSQDRLFCMIMLNGHKPLKSFAALYALLADSNSIIIIEQSFGKTFAGTMAAEVPVGWTGRGSVLEVFSRHLAAKVGGEPNQIRMPAAEITRIRLHKVPILGFSTYIETTQGVTYRLDSKYRYNSFKQVHEAFLTLFKDKIVQS